MILKKSQKSMKRDKKRWIKKQTQKENRKLVLSFYASFNSVFKKSRQIVALQAESLPNFEKQVKLRWFAYHFLKKKVNNQLRLQPMGKDYLLTCNSIDPSFAILLKANQSTLICSAIIRYQKWCKLGVQVTFYNSLVWLAWG